MKEIIIEPPAHREADRAIDYYRKKGMKPVGQFIEDLYATLEQIRLQPQIGSPYGKQYRFLKLR